MKRFLRWLWARLNCILFGHAPYPRRLERSGVYAIRCERCSLAFEETFR